MTVSPLNNRVYPDFVPPKKPPSNSVRKLIIDTDFLTYSDDAGAIAMANILQSMGYSETLGIVSDVTSNYSLPGIAAINTWYCHSNIPLSQTERITNASREPRIDSTTPEYIKDVSDSHRFPQHFDRSQTKTPLRFYKEILANENDNSVTIVAIGFLTNLNELLSSPGGKDLIRRKVRELIIQGGSPNATTDPHPAGYNLEIDLPASHNVIKDWPSPITFLPGFVGKMVQIGQEVLDISETNPIQLIYQNVTFDFKWGAYDILAVYYSILGLEEGSLEYGNVDGLGTLDFVPDPMGVVEVRTNSVWDYSIAPVAPRRFLQLKQSNTTISEKLTALLTSYGDGRPQC
ncbi:hypothetical protein Clacol_007668 [Clathrus columnatus]|uniref:Inosine/uridine-preferring nucleoside hydrolase domain-containing protein n=1 Tax=Clathrus columnatus TaxID=1419009 RepID=A0AAV5AJW9_9AGAM|nr:hypothetical protein Clacol_007668 [Clathrus columnatus]